jgi:hypothetical protein
MKNVPENSDAVAQSQVRCFTGLIRLLNLKFSDVRLISGFLAWLSAKMALCDISSHLDVRATIMDVGV